MSLCNNTKCPFDKGSLYRPIKEFYWFQEVGDDPFELPYFLYGPEDIFLFLEATKIIDCDPDPCPPDYFHFHFLAPDGKKVFRYEERDFITLFVKEGVGHIGDEVRVLREYNLFFGTVKRINSKSITVDFPAQAWLKAHTKCVNPIKIVKSTDSIAVVWEMWKGKNGRGAYRLEYELYPEYQRFASKWPSQAHLNETVFGVLDSDCESHGL